MKHNNKQIIAPIIIAIIVTAFYFVYFGFLITLLEGRWKYLLGIIPILLSFIMIKVCIERIKEIKKGEENDISKY